MARQDTTPGLGATEEDTHGPMKVLFVRQRYSSGGITPSSTAAIRALTKATGLSLEVVDTRNATLDALARIRDANEAGRPYDLVLSGLELRDSQVGGIQIAETVRAESLARTVVLYDDGYHPLARGVILEERGIAGTLRGPGIQEFEDVITQTRQAIVSPSSLPATAAAQ